MLKCSPSGSEPSDWGTWVIGQGSDGPNEVRIDLSVSFLMMHGRYEAKKGVGARNWGDVIGFQAQLFKDLRHSHLKYKSKAR